MKKTFIIERLYSGFVLTVDNKRMAFTQRGEIDNDIHLFLDSCLQRCSQPNGSIMIEIEETDNPPQKRREE